LIIWKKGIIQSIEREREGWQLVQLIDGDGKVGFALNDTSVNEPVNVGETVIFNATAVELGLGSGGVHFIIHPKKTAKKPFAGHIMKMRYTPLQMSVLSCEEMASPHHETIKNNTKIDRCPVLVGELHSMLPVLCRVLRAIAPDIRIAYCMTDGGALPAKFSDHVAALRKEGSLVGVITCGHAYGGDLEAVNKFTGLIAAKHVLGADIIIAIMGPGIVGTNTPYGFSGMEQGEWLNAVYSLNGIPVAVPRISFKDKRLRHYGLSYHFVNALNVAALAPAIVPVPLFPDEKEESYVCEQLKQLAEKHEIVRGRCNCDWQTVCSKHPVTTMGRTMSDDPHFFYTIAYAAEVAHQLFKGDTRFAARNR